MTHWTDEQQVRDDPGLRNLFSRLAATASEPVDPEVRHRHLQAMLTAAHEKPVAPVPAVRWRRIRRIGALTGTKLLLAAGVAAAAGTSGLAASGTLPPPAQHVVHDLGEHVGLDLPDTATTGSVTSGKSDPASFTVDRVEPLPDTATDAPGHDGDLPDEASDKANGDPTGRADQDVPDEATDAPGHDGDLPDNANDNATPDAPGSDARIVGNGLGNAVGQARTR